MSGARIPKSALPTPAAQVRSALDSGELQSGEQLAGKLDSLGLTGDERTRAATLAVGTDPDRYAAATVDHVCAALGMNEATLRSRAEAETTRLLAVAKDLSDSGELEAWMNEETGPHTADGEKVKKPVVSKVGAAIADAVGLATAPLANAVRRSGGARFDRRVKTALEVQAREVTIGKKDFDATAFSKVQLADMGEAADQGLDVLFGRKVTVTDAGSGRRRPLIRKDVVQCRAFVAQASANLAGLSIVAGPNIGLDEILADPKVASFLVSRRPAGEEPKVFLARYRQALSVLEAAGVASPSGRARKNAQTVRKGQAKFNDQVLGLVGNVPATIHVAGKRGKTIALRSEHLTDLVAATAPLVDGLLGLPVGLEDPVTGTARRVGEEDVAATHRILAVVADALRGNVVEVDEKTLSLDSILAKPEVAARILEHAAPGDSAARAAFQRDYHRAVGALLAQRQGYYIETSWPALLSPDSGDAGRFSDMGPVVVAVRRRPPDDVLRAMETLTHEYFQGITHLWFDDLMGADLDKREAAKARLSKAVDERGRALLDKLVEYRDDGASRMVAVIDGSRLPRFEEGIGKALSDLTRSVAERTARSAYYCGVAEDTAKEVLKVVGVGMVLGKGLDYGSQLLHNPAIEFWKPTVLGGWDDVLGGWVNVKELMDVANKFPDAQVRADRRAGAAIDGVIAVGAGVGSSVALGLPLIGGKSLGEAILAPGADALTRAGAAAFYGAASSGATAVLSVLPARHHVRPILDLVDKGIIEPPLLRGKPLRGVALKAWAIRHALKAHLSYTAQVGGALGVMTSAVFMAATSPILALPSALAASLVLSLGGAFETITTGAVLYGRRRWDDHGVKREFGKAIAALADPHEAAEAAAAGSSPDEVPSRGGSNAGHFR